MSDEKQDLPTAEVKMPFKDGGKAFTNGDQEPKARAARKPRDKSFVVICAQGSYVCEEHQLDLSDAMAEQILARYQRTGAPLSGSDPRFLVEHVIARSNFEHVPTQLTQEFVDDAFQNLLIAETTAPTP